jgi:hypothetical protein
MSKQEGRFLVCCRASKGFFETELLVMVASSSAYVSRDIVTVFWGPGGWRGRRPRFGVLDPEERGQGPHRIAGRTGGRRPPELGSDQ